ncbi:MAG: 3-hydroxyacyl-CoA dehydrogenase [Alphaproteobacteria bacterium]|jgi:3-hydroxyacyl-CoA dehydrogenase|nr:3-hydroxyacyl-CoA dehydrogenase [Alphaproteobacteria bacterium]
MTIETAAVIGAGVMGSGIAAHFANAGIPVRLLDVVPEGATDRNALAKGAVERMLKADPAPFMTRRAARLVTPGNLEDDLDALAECDWIVEAVLEDPGVKQALYARLETVVKPGAVVSSNTSTIPLATLTEGRSDAFKAGFLVTHFFNPPRYMRLMELVAGPDSDPIRAAGIKDFADRRLGKGVVDAKDTPGFIANRIGTLWLQAAVNAAIDLGLTVEAADAVAGRPMGVPKTGVFGLLDLVGLDLMPHIARSLLSSLPEDDPYRALYREEPRVMAMIEAGYTGRKGKGGFYRLNRSGGGRVKESVDLATGAYAPSVKVEPEAVKAAKAGGLRALVSHDSAEGRFAWAMLAETLAYAARLVPEICDTILGVDEAMRLGYAWKEGPFELIDRLGADWFAERLAADGRPVPPLLARAAAAGGFYRVVDGRRQYLTVDGVHADEVLPEGMLRLADVKRASDPVMKNGSAALWDIGDGVVCLEFTSKMNTLDDQTMDLIGKAVAKIAADHKALVIYNEGSNFSVGANLGLALFAVNIALWPQIEQLVKGGQDAYKALKYAPFPVVAAPSGMALGGGCEILLHADAVQAHAETYCGLVEAGVGLVPGWGGCKELLLRQMANPRRPGGPMPPVSAAFETIGLAKVAKSAAEAKELLFLRPDDGITMNRDRLLADAKARALALAADYRPPAPVDEIRLPGPTARAALDLAVRDLAKKGQATPHDVVVAGGLARVLSGGDTDVTETLSEDDLLALERTVFMDLVRTPGTAARVEHMLETGKPLRN